MWLMMTLNSWPLFCFPNAGISVLSHYPVFWFFFLDFFCERIVFEHFARRGRPGPIRLQVCLLTEKEQAFRVVHSRSRENDLKHPSLESDSKEKDEHWKEFGVGICFLFDPEIRVTTDCSCTRILLDPGQKATFRGLTFALFSALSLCLRANNIARHSWTFFAIKFSPNCSSLFFGEGCKNPESHSSTVSLALHHISLLIQGLQEPREASDSLRV